MNDSAQNEAWWKRLSGGLRRTSSSLGSSITALVTNRPLDPETLEALEDELVRADLGQDLAARIVDVLGQGRYPQGISPEEVKAVLAGEIEKSLAPVARPLELTARPFVILVAGVNGSGKTTIGKLAARYRAEGKTVMLVAGDTFRAAAIDQLKIWGERTGAKVVAREPGSDAAGLAFDAVTTAKNEGVEVVLIDTAGPPGTAPGAVLVLGTQEMGDAAVDRRLQFLRADRFRFRRTGDVIRRDGTEGQ